MIKLLQRSCNRNHPRQVIGKPVVCAQVFAEFLRRCGGTKWQICIDFGFGSRDLVVLNMSTHVNAFILDVNKEFRLLPLEIKLVLADGRENTASRVAESSCVECMRLLKLNWTAVKLCHYIVLFVMRVLVPVPYQSEYFSIVCPVTHLSHLRY
jgi:hypothetical protein